MDERMVSAVKKYVKLPDESTDDLLEAELLMYGLDSLKTINLILDLEELFDIQFPDELLTYDNMATLTKIKETIEQIQVVKHA
ncbi:Aminoacyl carrier protein [compost metagenome]